jgi:hypothetical protein
VSFSNTFYASVDSLNRSTGILSIYEKSSQEEYPNIKQGNQKQFLFPNKAYRTVDARKQKQYVKDALMVAYEAYGGIFWDIFFAADFEFATCEFNEKQRPDFGEVVNQD